MAPGVRKDGKSVPFTRRITPVSANQSSYLAARRRVCGVGWMGFGAGLVSGLAIGLGGGNNGRACLGLWGGRAGRLQWNVLEISGDELMQDLPDRINLKTL